MTDFDDDGESSGPTRATIAPPPVDAALLPAVQRAYDERRIIGIVQPRSKGVICSHEQIDGDQVAGCSALAVFRHVDEHDCPSCGKKTKEKSDEYCLAHTALKLAGALVSMQTSIFDDEGASLEADRKQPQALSGTTGAPVDAAAYPMVEDGHNEGFCICGYALDGPDGVNHDKRHAQFLAGVGLQQQSGGGKPPTDLTKHVAARSNGKGSRGTPPPKPARSRRKAT